MVHIDDAAAGGVTAILHGLQKRATLRLRVIRGTPKHLWAGFPAPRTRAGSPINRVPKLQPRLVVWELRAHLLNGIIKNFARVEEIVFGDGVNDYAGDVLWPKGLKVLRLGMFCNHPVQQVVWPSSLQEVVFGNCFDRTLDGVAWPASLQRVDLGLCFDQSIERVVWPASLRSLKFSMLYNQPIEGCTWP